MYINNKYTLDIDKSMLEFAYTTNEKLIGQIIQGGFYKDNRSLSDRIWGYGNQNGKDIKKVIAFQIGQTILLGCSIEVYTKSEISSFLPELKQFLYREDDVNMDLLNTFKNILIEFFSTEINECGENLVEINGIKYNHREEKKSKLINEDTETKEILA